MMLFLYSFAEVDYGLSDGIPVVPVGQGGHNEEGKKHGDRANVEKLVILYILKKILKLKMAMRV